MSRLPDSLFLRYYPWIILGILLSIGFYNIENKRLAGVLWSDAEGYYLYLPAVFIYGGFEGIPYRTTVQFSNYPGTEKAFTKYTCGIAMLELPFFLGAHWLARQAEDMPADGFSAYYRRGILAAGIFYAFLGIVFLRRVLERHFSRSITLLTIVCLFFGTNAYYYAMKEPGMSHIYSFFLFALFLYWTPGFLRRPTWGRIAAMGLLSGLIVLIRPTNIVLLLYLLLFNVVSWKDFTERLQWIWEKLKRLWLFPICSFLVFIPQFLYWKHISGDWLIYSYGDEGFIYWKNPKLMHVLFDITNGWLLFTPIAVFAIAGLYPALCRMKHQALAVTVICGISLYLFASWWSWYFGGAFGYRPMIEFYTLLALPFAYLAQRIYRRGSMAKKVVFTLSLFLMVYYTQGLTMYKVGPHYSWETWYKAVDKLVPYWELEF